MKSGAFTGAETAKPGMIELAHSGTLFLDEITTLNHGLQSKLLRVLQERSVQRLGGRSPRKSTSASSRPPTTISKDR